MGWAYGINSEGREVGYGVKAICDRKDCDEKIDRGLGYCCGGMHDGGEDGCGRYFCSPHLFFAHDASDFLCEQCLEEYEKTHQCPDCNGHGHDEDELCDTCDSFGVVA